MFSENWLERYGVASSQDRWALTELENFMPSRKERAVGVHCGENQGSCKANSMDVRLSLGGSLKNVQADVEVNESGAPEGQFAQQRDPRSFE
jgi:hypothetical protein